METPRFAVVIPALDEAARIGACLQSIEPVAAEVVVVDGGSSDDTVARASDFPGVRVLSCPPGRGGQLDFGARATSAARLLFLHADCRLPEGWSESAGRALDDPEVALTYFRLHTEPSDPASGRLARAWLRLIDLRSLGVGLPYGDQAHAVRREVFDEVGGFPAIPLMEDVAFARACRRLGRIQGLPSEVRTTGRRFERRPVMNRLCTATFPLLFRLGVSPWTLARWYREVR
ncbi:MAG: TIGR04283 family arsenosugar biosynthesis glycosyltransferase [Acidobacteriota bacterium]